MELIIVVRLVITADPISHISSLALLLSFYPYIQVVKT